MSDEDDFFCTKKAFNSSIWRKERRKELKFDKHFYCVTYYEISSIWKRLLRWNRKEKKSRM